MPFCKNGSLKNELANKDESAVQKEKLQTESKILINHRWSSSQNS
jgi:hypothetical protein